MKGFAMKETSLRLFRCATILVLMLTACSSPPEGSTASTPAPTTMVSGMVYVGGYALYYMCSGQGSPTVILESGGGADSSYWAKVVDGIEGTTRVCAYDRANLGQSD